PGVLARRSSAAGGAAFRTLREGQAAAAGRRVVAVPPAFPSQQGSGCGERVPKRRSVRTPVGPHCRLVLDRDENAASTLVPAGPGWRPGLLGGPGRPVVGRWRWLPW